jgi:hypothetical protein
MGALAARRRASSALPALNCDSSSEFIASLMSGRASVT